MKRSGSRRRSRSRSSSYSSSGSEQKGGMSSAHHRLQERRRLGVRSNLKKSNFTSGFDDQPPQFAGAVGEEAAPQQQMMSTAEILSGYRQQQSQTSFANHNKSERQLYVGNIPQNFTTQQLMELLNATLKEFGKSVNIFQDGDPIVGCWIAGEGHYAFADFRSAEEATQAFVLQQVQIHGQYLKVGRPKNSTGIIPTASQLLCGNPNFVPQSSGNNKKKNTSASLVQQALRQGQVINQNSEVMSSLNTKLEIMNFPATHTLSMIQKICEVFGTVKNIDMIKDPMTGEFKGTVHVELSTEAEAKNAHSSMMGLKIEDQVLFVKKITSISAPTQDGSGEVFKALIEDKPTKCLCLKNLVNLDEIEERLDYKELEFDIQDEMMRYGKCERVEVPRPPLFGDPFAMPGFSKAFALFTSSQEAERAKIALFRRRFNGRVVEAMYFPEEKLVSQQYE